MEIGLTLIFVVGVLTVLFSFLVKVIGLPDHIRKNRLLKSTKGVSTMLIFLLFLSYTLWTIYGLLANDWVVYLGHGIGIITTGIILLQVYSYRKKT